jgi:hypothetical protein
MLNKNPNLVRVFIITIRHYLEYYLWNWEKNK